ncbi:MAG: small multi-drug export protein [Clostridia bacterium]|nr:small multi-drug export protein [Clostridia bacterium]
MHLSLLGTTEIQNFFAGTFGGNAWLATILISMVPLIELKGGIIFGQSPDFFAEPLTKTQAFACGIIAGAIVSVVLTFLLKPIFARLKRTKLLKKLALRIEKSFKRKADKIDGKSGKKSALGKMLGIFIFTALPFPFTGVWTGTAIAVFLDLKWWQCLISTVAGNIVAGLIITLVSWVLSGWLNIVFFVILGLAALVLIFMIAKMVADSIKEKSALPAEDEQPEPDNTNTQE